MTGKEKQFIGVISQIVDKDCEDLNNKPAQITPLLQRRLWRCILERLERRRQTAIFGHLATMKRRTAREQKYSLQ